MNHLPDTPLVIARRDELPSRRKRKLVAKPRRIKHPVLSLCIALVTLTIGMSLGYSAPFVPEYFSDAQRIYMITATGLLIGASLSKWTAGYNVRTFRKSPMGAYVSMWTFLVLAFVLYGVSISNWILFWIQ